MSRIQKGILYSLLFILTMIPSLVNAQDTGDKISLRTLIPELESRFEVQFNYVSDIIDKIELSKPDVELTLEQTLKFLQESTGLFFISMGEFILIKEQEAQILCGFIKDKDDLLPLSTATIQGPMGSTVSDDNGYFELEVRSLNDLIVIRHIGYKSITRSLRNFSTTNCFEIFMIAQLETLEEVVIMNYIVQGINKINDGSFEIDTKRIGLLPGLIDSDVLQSIQAFPGIQSINETVSNLNIRGGTHDQNLILWDHIKMYQSGHFFGLISMYNPQITRKVSLIKNGSDVEMTDGVSGTIAMKTDRNINANFKGNIGINLTDINGFVDLPVGKKSSVQIAARKAMSDFVETPTYDKFFDRISQDTEVAENVSAEVINSEQEFDFYDTSLRWNYQISDNDKLRLNFINVSNELKFDETGSLNNQPTSRESSLTQNSIAGALHYERIWHDKLQTEIEIYETDYKLKAINVNVLDEQRFLQENVVSETSIKGTVHYHFNDQVNLKGGYHFVETEVTNLDDVDVPLFRLLISEVLRTHAGFTQLSYLSRNQTTKVRVGVRYNYLDKFQKHIIEPRFSFSQQIAEPLTLEVLGEFKHQNTSQVINFQNDFLGIEKRRWQLSNDDNIPVIESKQASLGLHFDQNDLLISAEGFYKEVKGITTQSQGFQNQYEFERTDGSYEVFGFDVLVRKRFNSINSWLSYSYMDNTYSFPNLAEVSFPNNFDITHAVTMGASYSSEHLKVSAGLNWHSGKPTTVPVAGNEIIDDAINYGPTNNETLEEYLRVDVSALYAFNFGGKTKAEVGASVWNVLNKENTINNFFKISNESVVETTQRSLGLTPNAIFRVYFN